MIQLLDFKMMSFISELILKFENNADADTAFAMEKYLKNIFKLYGVKAPIRKAILKETITSFKAELTRKKVIEITEILYQKPQRELHYCAIELIDRFLKKKYEVTDIDFIQKLIITNSWWDSVDFIAKHILGNYLLQFPNQVAIVTSQFSSSKNMWLNRSAILFQLGYKEKTDSKLLFSLCDNHKYSNEFFIKKAIGWALREYSKVNSEEVLQFVSTAGLKPLSNKEALKRIK
ncbi:DNA alkylation repair protein [Aquimarina sp. AD10]|uniref:DNA alkylation repair protein n=1 Tax=Aquimarina sp. AD10 TaxID=1714849 RepID=UPI000E487572|nr:DNA alkylation repair protein [Aquimarina sp. AD10]AXT59076.1 DNA alkylation repair protein [Aquimarina sp. AD10]RKM93409.1 DNA alkylation repair protein [Aquimarina sp. AD10]